MKLDHDVGVGCEDLIGTIEGSIERRWKSCDQDAYIAAVVLNPLLKMAPLSTNSPSTTPSAIWAIIQRLWKRFYQEDAPLTLFGELSDYLNGRNRYAQLEQWATNAANLAKMQVRQYLLLSLTHIY